MKQSHTAGNEPAHRGLPKACNSGINNNSLSGIGTLGARSALAIITSWMDAIQLQPASSIPVRMLTCTDHVYI